MTVLPTPASPSAYGFPLLVRQLLHTPLAIAPKRQTVYADAIRYDYLGLRARIGRLASALRGSACVRAGNRPAPGRRSTALRSTRR